MRQLVRNITKKTVMVAVAALVVGSCMTVGVFAAIPHSVTGVISACQSTVNGALRVIDTQSGASCGLLETALSWNSRDTTTALVRFNKNPSDPDNLIFDAANSRNVIQAGVTTMPTNPEDPEYVEKNICMQIIFSPQIASTTRVYSGGLGTTGQTTASEPYYASMGQEAAEYIESRCGAGYNASATYAQGNVGDAQPIRYFFSK